MMTQFSVPYLSQEFEYGTSHSLQTLHLTLPDPLTSANKDQIFLIYVHGGAWRDPTQSNKDFAPATALLLSNANIRAKIAGIASLNYGLSPYPSQQPPSDDPSRNYKHPQHIQDVQLALHWLYSNYHVGAPDSWDYVIVGHSCGATMALQVACALQARPAMIQCIGRPRAVVGVEGIYDLALLVQNHAHIDIYREFVVGAFGENEADWRAASPVYFAGVQLSQLLDGGGVVVVAHSSEDELVEQEQADAMVAALRSASQRMDCPDVIPCVLQGTHDEVWQQGRGLVEAISVALNALFHDLATIKGQESRVHS